MIKETLLSQLAGEDISVILKEETVSTSTDCRELIKNGLTSPLLVAANRQTGGRGRQGKSFLSPEGGLYMTIALPTDMPITKAMSATSCAGVAVCKAIRQVCGISSGIKWINDVYYDGKKLCGILAESVNDYCAMKSKYLLIGIGVNVKSTPVITDSSVEAISLSDIGISVSLEDLCAAITKQIMDTYRNKFDFSLYAEDYRSLSVLLGKEIEFTSNGTACSGVAVKITDNGALAVISDGKEIILDSGEVSVRTV